MKKENKSKKQNSKIDKVKVKNGINRLKPQSVDFELIKEDLNKKRN